MNTYVYEIDDNLYINLTNKCSNACTFCVRNGKESYFGNKLWLETEPTAKDVLDAINYEKKYKEIVFCGFGEPTYKIEVLVEVAKELKKKGYILRINTNGQGNLINKRDITTDLKGLIDKINVSLNAPTKEEYQALCLSVYGESAFDALLDFAVKCKNAGIDTVLSIVDVIGDEKIESCKELSKKIGVPLYIRTFIENS
ncbi:MAG: TatD family nuclease-associated radical SAM protein [Clostridia bacterium]|nr:TatD family nuclease-associated radical SAM protein [Clostridia bacterium]